MNRLFLKIYVSLQNSFPNSLQGLRDREDGQDMAEYALVVCLVALGAVAGMRALATGILHSYNTLSTTLQADV